MSSPFAERAVRASGASSALVSLTDIRMARASIEDVVPRTPLVAAPLLGRALDIDLHLKAECLQTTGSFKVRGATHKLRSLAGRGLAGVVTVSSGNHGQAVAYAARAVGLPAVVFVPDGTPAAKIEAARRYGADVRVGGELNRVDRLIEQALALAARDNVGPVHPFDDPMVIAGQGTCGLEIAEELPDVELVVVPVGGGGLIAGVAAAIKALRPHARVVGVGPLGASSMAASRRADRVVQLTAMPPTLADGIRTPIVTDLTLGHARALVDDIVEVDDIAIGTAVRDLWLHTKLLVEPAGAVGWAALASGTIRVSPGASVAIVLSGGNCDVATLAARLPW